MEDYLQIGAIGRSDISLVLRSPAHLEWKSSNNSNKQTEPMLIGSAVNDKFLQRDVYDNEYHVNRIDVNKRTNAGRAFMKELEDKYGDKIMNEYQEATVDRICMALAENSQACLMQKGIIESTLIWEDSKTGLVCRGRPDSIVVDGDKAIIYDLKTTNNAQYEEFQKSFFSYGYYIQAELYSRGLMALSTKVKEVEFKFICVESDVPHAVRVFTPNPEQVSFSKSVVDTAIASIAHCRSTGVYPSYNESYEMIEIPAWSKHILKRQMNDLARTTFAKGERP